MGKYIFIAIVLSLVAVHIQATTINRKIQKDVFCQCMDTYVRVSFEVLDKSLTNIKLINGSSNAICDKLHMDELAFSSGGIHPDGVTAIGVTGYTAKNKDMSYSQCLNTDEVEFDIYWFIEDVLIDLEKINRK